MSITKDKKVVLLMGGTGFVGQELGRRLVAEGYEVRVAARRPDAVRGRLAFPCMLHAWRNDGDAVPAAALTGCDAVINFVGENIAAKPWTRKRRTELLESRVRSVQALEAGIIASGHTPGVLIQASAIGYYGDRANETLVETSSPGSGFLAEVCKAWETAASKIAARGMRVVVCRLGLVLGASGGALPQLQGIYAMGLGADLGSGRQWLSWIHVDDLVSMFAAMLADERWQGAVNGTSPEPCQFSDFNRAMGAKGRYSYKKGVPKPLVKAAMGGRSALVLDSAKVLPQVAMQRGFKFRFATIDAALEDLLGGAAERHLRRLLVRQWVPATPKELWPFFVDARNLERLTPPFLRFHVEHVSTANVEEGTLIRYRLRLHGLPIGWESRITDWEPGVRFVDEQLRGPYSVWRHLHTFEPLAGGTVVTDDVRYRLPMAPLGALAAGIFVEKDVERIFAYRAKVMADETLYRDLSRTDGSAHPG